MVYKICLGILFTIIGAAIVAGTKFKWKFFIDESRYDPSTFIGRYFGRKAIIVTNYVLGFAALLIAFGLLITSIVVQ